MKKTKKKVIQYIIAILAGNLLIQVQINQIYIVMIFSLEQASIVLFQSLTLIATIIIMQINIKVVQIFSQE